MNDGVGDVDRFGRSDDLDEEARERGRGDAMGAEPGEWKMGVVGTERRSELSAATSAAPSISSSTAWDEATDQRDDG